MIFANPHLSLPLFLFFYNLLEQAERFRALGKGCCVCKDHFSFFNRKHTCKRCGDAVCSECSTNKMKINFDLDGTEKGKDEHKKKKKRRVRTERK